MKIGNLEVCGDAPVRIVAEIGNAHNGDVRRATHLISAAAFAGADFVKFQCYTPDELVALRGDGPAPEPWGSQGWSMRTLYEKAQTPHGWFPLLVAHCETVRIPWFSSVFGLESLALLELLDCPAYKFAALDMGSGSAAFPALYAAAFETQKPIIFSMRPERETQLENMDWRALLSCPAGYPQTDLHLSRVRNYDGFSYHGTDYMVPVYAVAAGARIVECHIQLDDEPSELEANVSLTGSQFGAMVKEIRRVETLL